MRFNRLLGIGLLGLLLGLAPAASAQGQSESAELYQRSYDTEATGHLAESLAALEKIPRKDTFVVQLRRAWLLYRLGRHGESVDAYNQATALSPKAVESRVGSLLPLMALRRWADAEGQAKAALKLEPGSYLATLRLAFATYNLHRYVEAETLYRRLSELYPSDVEVQSGLGWSLLKQGKTAEAVERFRAILEIAPRHVLAKEGLKAAGAP